MALNHHSLTHCYLYNLTTLCLNGTYSCVDFMDFIMGDVPNLRFPKNCHHLAAVDAVDVIIDVITFSRQRNRYGIPTGHQAGRA